MLGNYITIDGVSSRSLGIFCKKLPVYPVAIEGFNPITVGGRLDSLHQASGHYNDIQVDIEAVLIGFNMDPIIQWLSSGKRLFMSNQPDKYAIIKQLVAIDQKRTGNGALELKITLKLSPFKYKLGDETIDHNISPVVFKTAGNIYSEPLILAKNCSDGFNMTLNGVTLITSGLTGDIYIDVPNRVVYQLVNGVRTVVNDHTSGEIWNLLLYPSETVNNTLSFAWANSIQIVKNERWL